MTKPLRVAIVHDWLIGGGAELVVEQLHKLYPEAPIYTSYCTDAWRKRLDGKVVTGWLQHFGSLRKFIPFARIWWFTRLDLSDYDLVISSSGAEAKGVHIDNSPEAVQKRGRKTIHINYCHAPTHYYWSRFDEYIQHPGMGAFDWLARIGLRLLVGPLRKWDYAAAQRPDFMMANSTHIQQEIKKYYGRDAVVVFPPVYFERFQKPENANLPRSGFLISGRQTPYKRFDLAIQACTALNLPLNVIGGGPDNARLKALAGPTVTFLGAVSDEELETQFSGAAALIFPGLDDFGITAVEALAAGTPLIAYRAGGALDFVIPGKTGVFFTEPSLESLCDALRTFDHKNYISADIKSFSQRFSTESFTKNLSETINNWLD